MSAINESLKIMLNVIMKAPINEALISELPPRTIFHHGTFWCDCEICDNEINESNPGKEITYTENGKNHQVHVCNNCFRETDYLEIIRSKENLKIKPYKY